MDLNEKIGIWMAEDRRVSKWDRDFWTCNGHYHRRVDNLMVNPFTYEVLPDQWCKETRVIPPEFRSKTVSGVLWCNVGDHSFNADDPDAEEYTRSHKVKDEYGRTEYETKTLNVCGRHLSSAIKAIGGNGGDTAPAGKKIVDEEEYNRYLAYLESQRQ